MGMLTMTYEVGQEVVRRLTQARYGPGETVGTVVKVARKYCTVEFPLGGHGHTQSIEFDKETGYERDSGCLPFSKIKTADEWAASDRAYALDAALRKVGIGIGPRANATLAQVEAIARVMGVDDCG